MTVPAAELTAFSFDRSSLDFTHARPNQAKTAKQTERAIVNKRLFTPEHQNSQTKQSKHAQHLPQVLRRHRRRLQDLRQLWLGKNFLWNPCFHDRIIHGYGFA
jgi:hypothetical protein